MSTNINPNELPDVEALEKLANAFFSSPSTTPLNQEQVNGWLGQAQSPQIGNAEQWQATAEKYADSNRQNTAAPTTSLSNQGGYVAGQDIPGAVAGSGASPYANLQQPKLDLNNPQTSLVDPNFAGKGLVPNSVAGSGKSPSLSEPTIGAAAPSTNWLPFASDNSFEADLQRALRDLQSYSPTNQLPNGYGVGASNTSFNFLKENDFAYAQKVLSESTAGVSTPNTHNDLASIVKAPFDFNLIKQDFPILNERVNGHRLIWLDNAATTQKPRSVIERIKYFYEHENSNIHRAAHELAARATDAYEEAREKVRAFINAKSTNEVVFVRGTTEAINLVAQSWGLQYLSAGDEVIVSHLEHHANIVPWQLLAKQKGIVIKVIPVDEDGQILLNEYAKLLSPKTKLVSFTQVSNALGTITPAKQIIDMAHSVGAKVLLDGAQSVSHIPTDVVGLNCDWFVFSGHKVFGPTGIGVLYGKEELLNETQPWQGGGNMIKDVTFEHTEFHKAPSRFEAGTGNIADAVGLGAALDYVNKLGIQAIEQYEHALLIYATRLLKDVPGLRLIGTAKEKASVLSFVFDGFKTEEVGVLLNQKGIAVRAGHHCAQPILRRFGLESTVRPSLAFYNTCADVDVLVSTLHEIRSTKPIRNWGV